MNELIERARDYATRAHQRIDQRRKYSNQPYDVHLQAVAKTVASVCEDAEMIAAAWLHDVVEDTPATLEDVELAFGSSIAQLVQELTDISRPSDGNRAERKAIDRSHMAVASSRAKTVKLADLIDNCKDITKHDERFARVYLNEMSALLDVLGDGDHRLFQQARQLHDASLKKLGETKGGSDYLLPSAPDQGVFDQLANPHFKRAFSDLFTAKDIAAPLLSFDADKSAGSVLAALDVHNQQVASVRIHGIVQGYLLKVQLSTGAEDNVAQHIRHFAVDQVVDGNAPLADVIHVLTRYSYCFVSMLGDIAGVIDRNSINNPLARMWLYGILTMLEMRLVQLINQHFPQQSWQAVLSEGRLSKAKQMYQERQRRNLRCDLIDCLQLSDKAQILLHHQPTVDAMGFSSKKAAKLVIKELESLRNHLAHAQDIAEHNWAQIARLSQRMDEIVRS
ncbi:HD domain-containing protein [Kaarinaea lacus]